MKKTRPTHGQTVKALALINGREVLPGVTLPKKRRTYKRRTVKNDMREKRLEEAILINLRMMGYKAYKVGETSTYNSHYIQDGKADLEIFLPGLGVVYLEVKEGDHGQTGSQPEFEKLCKQCNLPYFIVRSLQGALQAVRSVQ